MRIINVPKWLMPWAEGMALPFKITLIRNTLKGYHRDYTIAHEQCHHNQMKRLGTLNFMWLYLDQQLSVGYYDNVFEVEARNYGREMADKWRNACCGSND